MAELYFFYEDLMREEVRERIDLTAEFLSLGMVKGKLYRLKESKSQYRHFLIPGNTGIAFGGIFLVENAWERRYPLHAIHNSASLWTGETSQSDVYQQQELMVTPIRIKGMDDLMERKEERGEPVRVSAFVGNPENRHIKECSRSSRSRKRNGLDLVNFLKLLKEQQ